MFSTLGQISALLALWLAGMGLFYAPAVAGLGGEPGARRGAFRRLRAIALGYAGLMLAANLTMVVALLQHDFSVQYVAQVGSRATPPLITIVSLWSSLAGSILFWGLILGVYLAAFGAATRHTETPWLAWSYMVLFFIAGFFAFLIAAPASPFLPVPPVADGPGPNPLLQNHWLMAIHPPMLYLGYVGMTLPFAVACAALIVGRLDAALLALMRQLMLWPWAFLSVGIVLGSWWAYEVLGWGGFWAWDPVENASFLPWLTATGFLHAAAMQERRRLLTAWTLSLVLATFLLTILGTFMTRSGVFNSVHSFTQSPIGPVFLYFLGFLLLVSVGLLGGRGHLLVDRGRYHSVFSRESAFLLNNVALVVFTFTVLLGTIFPLLTEALTQQKLSVGEPYFDRMAAPIGLLLLFLMGVGPSLPWGQPNKQVVRRQLLWPALAGVAASVGSFLVAHGSWRATLAFGLIGFASLINLRELVMPGILLARRQRLAVVTGIWRAWRGQPRRTGGAIVHLGIIAIALGITAAQSFRITREASLMRGDSMDLGDYTLTYQGTEGRQEPHRFAAVARMLVRYRGEVLGVMTPRLNFYPTQREPVATPHAVTLGSKDLYLSLLSVENSGQRVVIKGFVIPFVALLWRSLPLLVLGSVFSLWPRRQKKAATSPALAAESLP